MGKHFKRLISQIFVYGLGDTINRVIAILILPIFTRYLTSADFGIAALLTVSNALIIGLVEFGLPTSILRFYHSKKGQNKKKVVVSAQIVMVITTSLIALIIMLLANRISVIFYHTVSYHYLIILNFLTLPLTEITVAPMAQLRMEEKAKTYAIINVLRVVTGFGFNILFIIGLNRGVNGLFEGPLVNAALYALLLGAYSLKTNGLSFSWPLLKQMVFFGTPLVLNSVSIWILNWADRFILAKMTNFSEVGLYTLGYSVGMAILLPVGAFTTAWIPFYISIAKEKKVAKIYSLIFTYFSFGITFFVLLLAVFSRDYFYFFTKDNFQTAYIVVPLISLAYALRGNFSIASAGAVIKKRTILISLTELVAMALNIILMVILIPRFGRIGAAWATFAAYLIMPGLIILLINKIFPIRYDYKRLIQIFTIGLGLYFICQAIYQPTIWNVFVRLLILLIYPVTFFLLNFFQPEEIKVFQSFKNKLLRKNLKDEPTIVQE